MSALSNLAAFLKGELEVTLIPVAIQALAIYQKNPNVAGAAAAQAYALGAAPAALVTGEAALLQATLTAASTALTELQASGAAAVAKGP